MTRSISVFATIAMCLVLTVQSVQSQDPSATQVQEGFQLLKAENFESAISAFSNILRTEPENFQARLGLAIGLTGVERFPDASREIAKLLRRAPKDPNLLEMAARTLWQQRRYAETETVLRRRLALGSERAELWVMLGDALDGQKKTFLAIPAYEKAVRIEPDSVEYRYGLGVLYWKDLHFDDAKREFLEVLRRRPNDPRASFNLGDIYLTSGDPIKAIPYLETAAEAFLNEYDIHFALGRAYLATGKTEKALEQLEAAVMLRPEIPQGFYQLGRTFLKLGRREEANAAFKKQRELQTRKRFPDGIIELKNQ